MRAVSAAQMREIDRRALEEFRIPEGVLMEHAGAAAARAARRLYNPGKRGAEAVVLAGGGANGGDGFVAARHLANWGIPVCVVLLADAEKIRGAAQVNWEILRRLRLPLWEAASVASWRRWVRRGIRPGVAVDAMLGTGTSGAVREPVASAIRWVNRQRCPVIAVDIPSGLSADTGRPCGAAVKASVTVTFGLPKIGLSRGQGRRLSGRVQVADISLPKALIS